MATAPVVEAVGSGVAAPIAVHRSCSYMKTLRKIVIIVQVVLVGYAMPLPLQREVDLPRIRILSYNRNV